MKYLKKIRKYKKIIEKDYPEMALVEATEWNFHFIREMIREVWQAIQAAKNRKIEGGWTESRKS